MKGLQINNSTLKKKNLNKRTRAQCKFMPYKRWSILVVGWH